MVRRRRAGRRLMRARPASVGEADVTAWNDVHLVCNDLQM
jgi:hypothetical protein